MIRRYIDSLQKTSNKVDSLLKSSSQSLGSVDLKWSSQIHCPSQTDIDYTTQFDSYLPLKPSSSARAAEHLASSGATVPGFIGFGALSDLGYVPASGASKEADAK